MKFEYNDKWKPVQDVDITKRTVDEWAKIYGIKILNPTAGWWNEYEFAYHFDTFNYLPALKNEDGENDWDGISEKEMRARFLKRDLFMSADLGERKILENRYVETQWVRNHILRV